MKSNNGILQKKRFKQEQSFGTKSNSVPGARKNLKEPLQACKNFW